MNKARVYVAVKALFLSDGRIRPQEITWTDDEVYRIDKVLDYRPAAEQKISGQGDRYTVIINGRQRYLYFERNHSFTGNNLGKWYVEREENK